MRDRDLELRRQLAMRYPRRSADVIDAEFFWDEWPYRYGLTVNF